MHPLHRDNFCPISSHCQYQFFSITVYFGLWEHRVHGMVSLASLLSSSRLCDNYFHTIFSDVPESFTSGLPYHDLVISRQWGCVTRCRITLTNEHTESENVHHKPMYLIWSGTSQLPHNCDIHAGLIFHHILPVAFFNHLEALWDLKRHASLPSLSLPVICCVREDSKTVL